MEIEHISPSDLNLFEACPRAWYFEKIGLKGIAVDERAAMFGKEVHNCIVLYFLKAPDKPSPVDIKENAKKAFEEGAGQMMKSMKAKTKRVLKNFIDFEIRRRRTWRSYKPTFVEKKLEAKIFPDLPKFKGIVDFYGQPDATIIDWKTGGATWAEDNSRQGKIYEILLKANGYPVKRVIFFSLDTGQCAVVPKVSGGWIYKLARRMVDMAKSDRFPPRKSGLCEYCPYILDCQLINVPMWGELYA